MKSLWPSFARTTTFRLALVYSVMFLIFSGALLGYLYYSTIYYIRDQSEQRLTAELDQLGVAYEAGGMARLEQAIFERSTAPGAPFMYQLENARGEKLSGAFQRMPGEALGPDVTVYFEFEFRSTDGELIVREAAGRLVSLGEDGELGRLLVAFDSAQQTEIFRRIRQAILIAAPIGLLLSLIGGYLISRSAARRADELARTAEAVMAGELGRRAPVRGSNDEFDRLALRMNAMLDQIGKLMEATRNSGNAIAHDLRSPLSRLRNRLEIALNQPMTPDLAQETLAQTVEEVDSVLGTFDAILRLSRVDAGAEGKRVKLNVSALAEELAELFEPACEEAQLSFKSYITRGLSVLGDRELIAQAIVNLLDNAVKYTPAGGAIEFRLARGQQGMVEISVLDTGPGIPEDKRADAIERFTRMDSARTLPGSGLGLSLVEAVAEFHEGEFDLLDGRGPPQRRGLKAVLRIPRA